MMIPHLDLCGLFSFETALHVNYFNIHNNVARAGWLLLDMREGYFFMSHIFFIGIGITMVWAIYTA